MRLDVVVLAGGKNDTAMAEATGVENRALTPIGTRAMLDYIVSALNAAPSVGQIYVVGDVPESDQYSKVPVQETLLENLMAGLRAAGSQERVLISTSDIPFVTPLAVEDFVQRAAATGADLCCSYVPLAACLQKYPEMKRTAITLAEGRFTLGNIMLVNPRFLEDRQTAIAEAYAARKSPVKMARLLGPGLLARLLGAQLLSPRLLTVKALEDAVSRVLGGARTAGICSAYAEIGTDIDKPEDVIIARRILANS
jgi:GTP:adenosylcobinamide-phosphate guanylyltransferase